MKSILQAYYTRVFIPVTATLIFAILALLIAHQTDERGIVLLFVACFWFLVYSSLLVVFNFLLLRVANPVFDYKLRNDFISIVYLLFGLYFLLISEDAVFISVGIFFLIANVSVILYCRKKKIR